MTYLKKRLRAFKFAFSGIYEAFVTEAHIKIHTVITVLVIAAGIYVSITKLEWILIALAIALVFMSELFNTAIEKICDFNHPGQHPNIKFIKDISAAAVLFGAVFALIVGLLIFYPYLKIF
ncbi:MAG: diacylglycerol kinase family protein [bacterium]|nr:diacylglycerol kinase family protein [bacterium]